MTKRHLIIIPLATMMLAATMSVLAAATGNEVEVGYGWFRFGPPDRTVAAESLERRKSEPVRRHGFTP